MTRLTRLSHRNRKVIPHVSFSQWAACALVSMACAVGAVSTGALTAGASADTSDPDVSIRNFGLNLVKQKVALPLFRGTSGGKAVTYVVTDSSSRDDAAARGVAYAPKLLNALGTKAVQRAAMRSTAR